MNIEGILEANTCGIPSIARCVVRAASAKMDTHGEQHPQDEALTLSSRDSRLAAEAIMSRLEKTTEWVYRGIWGVLTDWFRVPPKPPHFP